MADIMKKAEDFLNARLNAYASEAVEYCPRGVSQWKKVNAVIGKSLFQGDDVNGFSIHLRSIDFIINAEALGLEPKKGDTIVRNGKVYEVYEPNNEPCWVWSGSNHDVYRIHTQSLGDGEYNPLGGGE